MNLYRLIKHKLFHKTYFLMIRPNHIWLRCGECYWESTGWDIYNEYNPNNSIRTRPSVSNFRS